MRANSGPDEDGDSLSPDELGRNPIEFGADRSVVSALAMTIFGPVCCLSIEIGFEEGR